MEHTFEALADLAKEQIETGQKDLADSNIDILLDEYILEPKNYYRDIIKNLIDLSLNTNVK